eukprot:TRINITY_DN7081_c0_g1_i1.p1 TRINITY_DN7081_c0_g1~~TRINITY_DN7081_c0_g1_i1.p1  ORF type:complete len:138 (-),score=47.55 TRINITY_DN7081_c0_g1_i1:101-514(-)
MSAIKKLTLKERWLAMVHKRLLQWWQVGGDERWSPVDPANYWWGSPAGLATAREERQFFPSYYQRDLRRLKRKTYVMNRPLMHRNTFTLAEGALPPRPHLNLADPSPFWWQNHPKDQGDRTTIYQTRNEDAHQQYPR